MKSLGISRGSRELKLLLVKYKFSFYFLYFLIISQFIHIRTVCVLMLMKENCPVFSQKNESTHANHVLLN